MRVAIGVHVHEDVRGLQRTLAALRAHPHPAATVLLAPDGPDRKVAEALRRARLPQLPPPARAGMPACFNAMAAATDTEVVVLLESGAQPGPGWLELLLAALGQDPRNGLAGPSTNQAWNEQCVEPGPAGDLAAVVRTAERVRRRYGSRTQTLEPLHSLCDFCYCVRREVIDRVGAADEDYGLGPCWEMEYNARAARAGYSGVWACGAYVARSPFTPRRARAEPRLFEIGRRRYQDALCGLRLRHETAGYQPHCRGEACEEFAPPGLIQIHRPLPTPPATVRSLQPAIPSRPALPLVSCVMPTRDRRDFALQAVRLFQRQEYPRLELIVVDDGHETLADWLPADERLRLLRVPTGTTIGEKRNRACAAAGGEVIAQWDDDDWYSPTRIREQVQPILDGRADVTGLRADCFFELDRWLFWSCTPELHRQLFVGDVHGGTLVYRRSVWEHLARYPHASLAEDAGFLRRAMRRGARLVRLPGSGLYLYVRHGGNSWAFACGTHGDRAGWRRAAEPHLPPVDRAFYAKRSPAVAAPPLVSCIMPTADRRRFAGRALEYFTRQDYPSRELVIVDDGEDRIGDLVPSGDSGVRYYELKRRLPLGEKRNRACELAGGEWIAHWDDDDWQASHRLGYEIGELERHGAELGGAGRQLYADFGRRNAWLYSYPPARRRWVGGSTLCYRRDLWERIRFEPIQQGEDTRFVWAAQAPAPLALDDHAFQVALLHPGNTSRKVTSGSYWQPFAMQQVDLLLGGDAEFYANG